ncbi:hemagglutinin/amebocyte aggregation factor-like [Conger conger]|uniref:hemagglutinin/amebocyte aggregation factor-like n=1 Tax=Conger conger TaxID=82655 RepID=UPI002A5AEEA8|nr:hemagglutinin/amebocyte aggregation factor-like [Conger conger]
MNKVCFLVFLIAGFQVHGNEAWENDYDEALNFQCPDQTTISEITSQHHNRYEDRRWDFRCKRSPASTSCFWTVYVNGFDKPVHFSCPNNHIISGMSSYHQNQQEDRRWRFYCCAVDNYCSHPCSWTPYVNNFDEKFTWVVPHGSYLAGVRSYHNNHAEDRRWRFKFCASTC